ncbi:MAG: pyruvate dehydrogenase complex dihydrolipoamide acetyltransferase [Acidobacteria bacterium]|nr:MAG: pyruvate dehydrogenase complex dihydrolipoamide acetyltransferase [Acidobacteriota bacterium]REK01161.1 MAG: pyruvate dehydrogenase complex dihydrolipoamide acetyltransferase [Acidobacteriota bacterium]REK14117.1 MAG: pyruvate dehydrogenase complex dihydrolipoamide acetyltransferase [Acidobacteriota bacterium]REK44832.1 MAG: pyruvate dehydrogenase complex dihydrolipoamide acetyltransferase [Acidobacteriota bacterium]
MAEKILMPKLSPTMEEGQISSWLKEEGDSIEANETIAEVDTDKATMEMTSLTAGTLLKIIVPAGENARLGQIIGVLGEPGEDFSDILEEAKSSSNGAAAEAGKQEPEETSEAAEEAPSESQPSEAPAATTATSNGDSGGRLLVSPIAARMASENGIDLRSISGSGPNGRIIKRDIEKALEAPSETGETAEPSFVFGQRAEVSGASAFREENTSPMRRTIAKRLAESIGPIPTFYLTIEIEMDGTLATRKHINEAIAPDKISVNDIIVKAAAMALTRHPFVNASYQDDKIKFYEDADIGVAVAIDEGLITPVVRGANKKGFVQISSEISDLAAKAREKKLQPEEYTGATFSISNLGMFGIKEFTAIINPPEAAILAVGRAEPVPVVRDGEMVVRNIMHVTMSCDHRVVDGATGAKFLQTFKQMLENPAMMLA